MPKVGKATAQKPLPETLKCSDIFIGTAVRGQITILKVPHNSYFDFLNTRYCLFKKKKSKFLLIWISEGESIKWLILNNSNEGILLYVL